MPGRNSFPSGKHFSGIWIFWETDLIFFQTSVMGWCWKQDILVSETTEEQVTLIAQSSLLLSHMAFGDLSSFILKKK